MNVAIWGKGFKLTQGSIVLQTRFLICASITLWLVTLYIPYFVGVCCGEGVLGRSRRKILDCYFPLWS